MSRTCRVALTCATLLASGSFDLAGGNGAVYGTHGRRVVAEQNDRIRMRSERIRIEPRETGGYRFRCQFHFENTGESTTVRMGFPIAGYPTIPDSVRVRIEGGPWFSVASPAEELVWDRDPESVSPDQVRFVYLWPVHFAQRARLEMSVEYDGSPGGGDMSLLPEDLGYILTTGALWKGKLDRSEISFRFAEPMPRVAFEASPGDFEWDGREIRWDFRNIDPAEDVWIRWSSGLSNPLPAAVRDHGRWRSSAYRHDQALLDLQWGEWREYLEQIELEPDSTPGSTESSPADLREYQERARIARDEILARRSERHGSPRHRGGPRPPKFSGPRRVSLAIEQCNLDYCEAVLRIPAGLSRAELAREVEAVVRRYW